MDQAKKDGMRRRLKACAALMASDNEHEAEAARRQAEAIMREYQMDAVDARVADVEIADAKSGAAQDPPTWERRLANLCASAYACELVYSGTGYHKAEWRFVGMAPAATLAAYAMDALATKHRGARRRYVGTKLKRYKVERNKRAAADTYSAGWIEAIRSLLRPAVAKPDAAGKAAIARFMEEQFGELSEMKPRKAPARAGDHHAGAGYADGSEAELHGGVGAGLAPKRIGRDT